jgi:hypothetical protein
MSIIKGKENKEPSTKETGVNTGYTNPINQLFAGGGSNNTQQLIDAQKIITTWLSKKHLNMKTNLDQNQINSICTLMTMAHQFKIKYLHELITNFLMYMISKGSQSAEQLVNILQSKGLLDSSEIKNMGQFIK